MERMHSEHQRPEAWVPGRRREQFQVPDGFSGFSLVEIMAVSMKMPCA